MKRLYAVALWLCIMALAVPALAGPKAKPAAKEPPKKEAAAPAPGVLARVGQETITEAEVQEVLNRMSPRGRPPDAKRQVLNNIVELYVFANEARKAGLDKDPEVLKRLHETTTVVLARAFFERNVTGKAEVPDADAMKVYEQNKVNYLAPAQIKVEQILVKDKAKADEVLARLKKGEDFAELAKKESKDPMSAAKGGDLGWKGVDSFDPNFIKAVETLKKGELSQPVQTRLGFHIVRLLDRKEPRTLTFDEVKNPIKEGLQRQAVDKLRKQYVDKADVQIFLPEGPGVAPAGEEAAPTDETPPAEETQPAGGEAQPAEDK